MGFAVFLDVDGVLNTSTTVKQTPYGYTGIDDARVEILAHALEKYGADAIRWYFYINNMVEETLFFHLIGKNLIPSMMIMCISYQN